MPASSVPKHRLVDLILTRLQAAKAAASHFHISTASALQDRLMSMSKPELIAFIGSLGPSAEAELDRLASNFPLRRAPTLYLAFMESGLDVEELVAATRLLAKKENRTGFRAAPTDVVQSVFVDEGARTLDLQGKSAIQVVLRYLRRIEYVVADPKSEHYGMAGNVTSLETAFVWIPGTRRPKHVVIASCDYPAVHHLLAFGLNELGLRLYLTNLDLETLRTLVAGATPRSATFSTTFDDPKEVKTLTISDPVLSSKPVFTSAVSSSAREQTAGFYVNHPGLPAGGMGVSRREGRVWIPSRLDYSQLAQLALQLIEQTENKLKAQADPNILVTHYYANHARIGNTDISGPPHAVWMELLHGVLRAARDPDRQSELSASLLERLVRFQAPLFLASGVMAECPSCGYSSLAVCPACHVPVSLRLSPGITMFCRTRGHDVDRLLCDCGTALSVSTPADVYLVPEPPLIESINRAAGMITEKPFEFFFIISGTLLRLSPSIQSPLPEVITLSELALWKSRAHMGTMKRPRGKQEQETIRVLNRTKEKCLRDHIRPSIDRCSVCKAGAIDPGWLPAGNLCLPRVFGVAIDEPFDGVHHGLELADIKYGDTLIATGRPLKLGIHLKSRLVRPPALGVGRSKHPIKGLYAQLVHSAYTARSSSAKFDVLGVAMPNLLLPEVLESMRFATNMMGFSFLAITEEEWLKIMRVASEKIALGA